MDTRTCAFCEYFDGGGERIVDTARYDDAVVHGDCLCNKSPRFEKTSRMTCSFWYFDTDGDA